jgi:lipoate-protein ligase A
VSDRTWRVERASGDPAAFHAREVPSPASRTVWAFTAERRTLVLGSSQPDSDVDGDAVARTGTAIVRRRSGGGAVLLEPGQAAWVDVILPRRDPRWAEDVVAAPCWLGDVWASALAGLGLTDLHVHRGRLEPDPWSRLVCFAGVASGEVRMGTSGPKLVGISQRRTRDAARFQCVALRAWDPAAVLDLLALDGPTRQRAAAELAGAAAGVDVDPAIVLDAVVAGLRHSS